jgi:hypothetical protein
MATSKFLAAKPQIAATIAALRQQIFKQADVSKILAEWREQWELPKGMTGAAFGKKLVDTRLVREHKFPFPQRTEKRYAKPHVPMLEVMQSLKPNAYYTHTSALKAHGLLEERLDDIYLNFEQGPHERSCLPEQSRIDAAFQCNPRRTSNVIKREHGDLIMLNGMQTGLLGVEEKLVEALDLEPAKIRVTNLERTLIDITVRPYYSGDVESVLRAFELARNHVNVSQLLRYLAKLNYVYPVHQALGWYMGKAGYKGSQLKELRATPKERRFYLTHRMKEFELNDEWQIFVPTNLV